MVLAHLLYDFHWQGDFIAKNKGKRLFLLFIHALTWAMLLGAPLALTGHWLGIVFLFATHFFTDMWKSRQQHEDKDFYKIYIDQGIHFASILITYLLWLK